MLTLSFLTLLALPAQAESPPCDCLDGPLLTGAPPCVEVGFAGCYLGAADTSLINQCGAELVLVDFPVDDGLGGVCDAAPCVVAPGETAHFINSVGSYTLELDGEAYAVDMNLECEVGGGGESGEEHRQGDRCEHEMPHEGSFHGSFVEARLV